jgi:tRNA A37 threonylcarbamoyladenosine dehydratase
MESYLERLKILLGEEKLNKLQNAKVLVAGLGGVGSFCAEALVRCGIGTIGLLDSDKVETSNLNRQLIALNSTKGQFKTDVFEQRAKDINSNVEVHKYPFFLNKETFETVDFKQYDIVADCIDSLVPKLNMIIHCLENNIKIVASTGSGFKTDPTQIQKGSIWKTKHDPLAYRMRKKMRQWGFGDKDFKVVYSLELNNNKKISNNIGSIVTVTGTFGLTVASLVIEELVNG